MAFEGGVWGYCPYKADGNDGSFPEFDKPINYKVLSENNKNSIGSIPCTDRNIKLAGSVNA